MFSILARRTRIEEAYLIARFGDQYRRYMDRVGRFFPRFT
jgi:protein-S-isoprenylcysteine O-methyltransferase Ste14